MGVTSILFGVIGLLLTLLGLIPFLGIILWISIPLLAFGLVFGIIGACVNKNKGTAIAGIVICCIFLIIGGVRLAIGMKAMGDFANPTTIEQLNETTKNLQGLSDSLDKLNNSLKK